MIKSKFCKFYIVCCIQFMYMYLYILFCYIQDMDRDVQSKTDQVKELALRGKDLQDFCKGTCRILV